MKEMPEDDKLYTFEETMAYLKVSRSTLYKFIYSNELAGYKVGRMWRFYLADLRSFVKGKNGTEEVAIIDEQR